MNNTDFETNFSDMEYEVCAEDEIEAIKDKMKIIEGKDYSKMSQELIEAENLHKKIKKILCGENVSEQYQLIIKLKEMWAKYQAIHLSKILEPEVSNVHSSHTSKMIFFLEDFKKCLRLPTMCDFFQVFSGVDPSTGNVAIIYDHHLSGNVVHPLTGESNKVYLKLMNLIADTEYEIFNPLTKHGFWQCITIKTSIFGKVMLVIEAYIAKRKDEAIANDIEALTAKLRRHFHVKTKSTTTVNSLIMKIRYKDQKESVVVFGDDYVVNTFGSFRVHMYEESTFWPDRYGLEELSNTIVSLSSVNKTWGIILLGCEYDIPSLELAKICGEMFVTSTNTQHCKMFIENAKRNRIHNVHYVLGSACQQFENIFLAKLNGYENICILLSSLHDLNDYVSVTLLRNNRNVKKIIYIAKEFDPADIKKLVVLCKDDSDWVEPFIIVKAVPVDIAPFKNDVRIVYLLMRTSLLGTEIVPKETLAESSKKKNKESLDYTSPQDFSLADLRESPQEQSRDDALLSAVRPIRNCHPTFQNTCNNNKKLVLKKHCVSCVVCESDVPDEIERNKFCNETEDSEASDTSENF